MGMGGSTILKLISLPGHGQLCYRYASVVWIRKGWDQEEYCVGRAIGY